MCLNDIISTTEECFVVKSVKRREKETASAIDSENTGVQTTMINLYTNTGRGNT